jgi:acyl-ACP thioesterase
VNTENTLVYKDTIKVNYFECDFQNHWKPSAIFQHLTETAGTHADHLGFGFEKMATLNLFWVHSRMKIKFLHFPTGGEKITIYTWPKTIQQKLFYIRDFEVFDTNGQQVAAATSAWLIIDATTRKMVSPHSLQLVLPELSIKKGLDEPLEKININGNGNGKEKLQLMAGYSAVDFVGHVNNSRYVEWICDCFPIDAYQEKELDWLQINYEHEVRPGEKVSILTNDLGDKSDMWMVEGINRSGNNRAFTAMMHWTDGMKG